MPDIIANIPCVVEVLNDVIDTLGSVKRANGYHIDLQPEKPKPRMGNTWVDGRAVVWLGKGILHERQLNQYEDVWQDVMIRAHVIATDAEGDDIETKLWTVAADIEHVLTHDDTVRKRGRWAITTEWQETEPLPREADSNEADFDVRFRCHVRTRLGNRFRSGTHPSGA